VSLSTALGVLLVGEGGVGLEIDIEGLGDVD